MFRKTSGSQKVCGKKAGGGNIEYFRRIFFCLEVPKIFVGESYSLSVISGIKKIMLQRVMSRFSVESFFLTVPKQFVEKPFCALFQKKSGSEKVYGIEG